MAFNKEDGSLLRKKIAHLDDEGRGGQNEGREPDDTNHFFGLAHRADRLGLHGIYNSVAPNKEGGGMSKLSRAPSSTQEHNSLSILVAI